MIKEIILKGLDNEETIKVKKVLSKFENINIVTYRNRLYHAKKKQEIKNKLIDYLQFNNVVEVNKNLCSYFKIHPRTFNRYIHELIKENKINAKIENFKGGGRGYVVQSIISKEKR